MALENRKSSAMDLGIIGEYAYDGRSGKSVAAFDNDVVLGTRLAVNDAASSELLFGFVQDLDNSSRALSIEASRRIGSNWKLSLEGWGFFNVSSDDAYYSLRNDDFLELKLSYYF
jgi:hypothetical protein